MRTIYYNGYAIEVRDITRDWSEGAVEYTVLGTSIKDECEDHMVMECVKADIEKLHKQF